MEEINGELTTLLALPPEEGGYANDPILGVVQNLGLEGLTLDIAEIYVGILAATILFIATNAGVIGASRITYSMASYRQLPERLRTLHPRFKTPWLSLVVFAGIIPILLLVPGDVNFIGTLYSLGATLSFTVAHASLIRLRMRDRQESEVVYPRVSEHAHRRRQLAAVRHGGRHRDRRLVPRARRPEPDDALGRARAGWSFGLIAYTVYRRRFVHAPLRRDREGAACVRPGARARVPPHPRPDRAGQALGRGARHRVPARGGARRAYRRRLGDRDAARPAARGVAPELESLANRELDEAVAIGDSYGVPVVGRLERARAAGPAIVAEAEARQAEIIVLGAPRGGADRPPARGLRQDGRLRPQATHRAGRSVVAVGQASRMRRMGYRVAIVVFSIAFVVIGCALLVRTAVEGGGVVGFVLGGLFIALGVGRLVIERKRPR